MQQAEGGTCSVRARLSKYVDMTRVEEAFLVH
jgi:hypothetical protein